MPRFLAVIIAVIVTAGPARAGETLVAVAANFTAAARDIGAAFADATGHTATFSFGSTGKLYAQIAHGAPFEVFLAADAARPQKAEAEGLGMPGTRFTYAMGRLVLYSADPDRVDPDGRVLTDGSLERLAIANPVTAPYGAAAIEALKALGVHEALAPRLVQGDSITQVYQFLSTGAVPAGMVALSQVIGDAAGGSQWRVPDDLYAPIRQDAILLRTGADTPAARAFLDFLKGPEATAIVQAYGYGTE